MINVFKCLRKVGKIPLLRDNWNILVKTGVKINLKLYRRIEGIPSRPELELRLKLEIKLRISSSMKDMEFIFKSEFQFMLLVFREEELS